MLLDKARIRRDASPKMMLTQGSLKTQAKRIWLNTANKYTAVPICGSKPAVFIYLKLRQ
jgi:hypothetical protein